MNYFMYGKNKIHFRNGQWHNFSASMSVPRNIKLPRFRRSDVLSSSRWYWNMPFAPCAHWPNGQVTLLHHGLRKEKAVKRAGEEFQQRCTWQPQAPTSSSLLSGWRR